MQHIVVEVFYLASSMPVGEQQIPSYYATIAHMGYQMQLDEYGIATSSLTSLIYTLNGLHEDRCILQLVY